MAKLEDPAPGIPVPGNSSPPSAATGTPPPGQPGPATLGGCFLHVLWKIYGPAALVAIASAIMIERSPSYAYDVAYGITAALVLAARAWEARAAAGSGRPAPAGEWRRFAVGFVSCAGIGLLLAHLLGRMIS